MMFGQQGRTWRDRDGDAGEGSLLSPVPSTVLSAVPTVPSTERSGRDSERDNKCRRDNTEIAQWTVERKVDRSVQDQNRQWKGNTTRFENPIKTKSQQSIESRLKATKCIIVKLI
jgi:hypothetical protein